jgi:hypothetical protein
MDSWSTFDWCAVSTFWVVVTMLLKSVAKAHGLLGTLQWLFIIAGGGLLGFLAVNGLVTMLYTLGGIP